MFGATKDASITDLGVVDAEILGGGSNQGVLIGDDESSNNDDVTRVENCYTTGSLSGGLWRTGGFIGDVTRTKVTACYSSVAVSGYQTGAFVGYCYYGAFESCYSNGSVSNSGNTEIGGFVGANYGANYTNCYASGVVSPDPSTAADKQGGFAALNNYGGQIIGCYWDAEITGQTTSAGITGDYYKGLTTVEFAVQANFMENATTSWDFTTVWEMGTIAGDNNIRPRLQWQEEEWSGTTDSDWHTATNWINGNVPTATSNVVIPTGVTNYPTISAAATCKDILIENGASLIGSENLTVSGEATMQCTIDAYTEDANGWHLLSSPVSNMAIAGSDFEPGTSTPNLDDFYGWDEINNQWLNQKVGVNNITNFVNGTGYLVSYQATETKDFTGTFNNSDITFTNLSSTTDKGDGWHLVGNPFQSALQWTNSDWVRANICNGGKIMNNGGGYTDITVGGTDIIPANQGFFIQATTNNSNTFTIPKSQRVHSSTAFYKNEILNFLTLKAIGGNYYQESCVQFMDGSTEAYDAEFDVRFFSGMAEVPQIYSICGEELLSTNRISTPEDETTIPFGFNTFTEDTITIEASGISSFNNEYKIVLEDLLENKLVDLQENPRYTFESKPEYADERFLLHFKSTNGVEGSEMNSDFEIYSFSRNLYIENPNRLEATVVVYNTLGKEIKKMQINGDMKNNFYLNIEAGYYVVKVISNESITTKKVYLK